MLLSAECSGSIPSGVFRRGVGDGAENAMQKPMVQGPKIQEPEEEEPRVQDPRVLGPRVQKLLSFIKRWWKASLMRSGAGHLGPEASVGPLAGGPRYQQETDR